MVINDSMGSLPCIIEDISEQGLSLFMASAHSQGFRFIVVESDEPPLLCTLYTDDGMTKRSDINEIKIDIVHRTGQGSKFIFPYLQDLLNERSR